MEATPSNLLPASVIEALGTPSGADFQRLYAGVLLLVIDVGKEDSDLVRQLGEVASLDGDVPVASTSETLSTLEMGRIDLTADPADLAGPGRVELLARLGNSRHFVLPLLKRRHGPADPANRVSVGRALGCDVVLADPSVSGAHAFFERDPSGAMSLVDAGSKNGTHVNGERLDPHDPIWIQPMDHIQFGGVSSFTCAPGVLRGVVKRRG